MRKNALLHRLPGHTDTVTGLELSPDGCYLLSNAMDNSLRIWDVRPYAPADRCLKVFSGHTHNFEKVLILKKYIVLNYICLIYVLFHTYLILNCFLLFIIRTYCGVRGHQMVQKCQRVQLIDMCIFGMPTLVEYCTSYRVIMGV